MNDTLIVEPALPVVVTLAHSDISRRALSLARAVDRLEDGKYIIELSKLPDVAWQVRVYAREPVYEAVFSLDK